MKSTALALLAVAGAATLFSSATHSEELSYTSADFAFDGEQLMQKNTLSPTATAVLYCRADISVEGQAKDVSCYEADGNAELSQATEQSLKQLPFKAATVDEQAVPVRMSFRIAYTQLENGPKAVLMPNLGTMQNLYGRNYVAPQERLDVSDWYALYSEHSWSPAEAWLGEGDHARVALMVDSEGAPDLVRTIEADKAYERDAQIISRNVKRSEFLPGSVNGKPVDMQYVLAVHYNEQHRSYARAH